jgi:DNA mismatch repair protein MutS
MINLTPGMQQYMNVKNQNPDCIIFFRMGDFYETFFEDAKTVAKELEITLTSRGKGDSKAPLAGIPYHALDPYLSKLIKKGYKVGIVEQIEDPKKAKGLVKRELVKIITPGTLLEKDILENSSNNYILSLNVYEELVGISFCDLSTNEFFVLEILKKDALNFIRKISPAEILFPESLKDSSLIFELEKLGFFLNSYEDRFFSFQNSLEVLLEHFKVLNLKGFGDFSTLEISCAGAIVSYLKKTQKNSLVHLNKISNYNLDSLMHLDYSTIKNLELISNIQSNSSQNTLLSVLDKTITPMGKRLIKKWILSPLLDKEIINERLNSVLELKENPFLLEELKESLDKVYDIQRLISRVSVSNANPRDLVALKLSLLKIPLLKRILSNVNSKLLKELSNLPNLDECALLLENSIKKEPSLNIREGNIIKTGYNFQLDELRTITKDARIYLAQMEEKEKKRTGIKSLKINYNKVMGYFIEVTKSNLSSVPVDYIRKQTQVNSERFITEDLKQMESKILGAQEKIYELEYELFFDILEKLKKDIPQIQETANKISQIDVLTSFGIVSLENNYCKPILNDSGELELIESRHPVIEKFSEVSFISNDCSLDYGNRTILLTGPNMAGKSTYLRQIALSILMAQIGCFVPATKAKIPLIDKIFSRIGAYDDLVNQQSTFMVEMNETANILNNATKNSFVILDEIGRGTSTFDGVSLAWAIAQYLNEEIKCKTLFATHYHHLNQMQGNFSGIKNYQVLVQEQEDKILFLRKIQEGGTDKSYGIQVAKLAGVPQKVVSLAKQVMQTIEQEDKVGEQLLKSFLVKSEIFEKETKEELKIKEEPEAKGQSLDLENKLEKLEEELNSIKELFKSKNGN